MDGLEEAGGGDDFPPAIPSRWRYLPVAASVLLVAFDGVFWHGFLFGSRFWHVLLWLLVAVGLALGCYAYWRRCR